MKPQLRLVAPITEMRTVAQKAPGRRPNAELRTREHLTGAEVDRLMEAVKDNRHGHRDTTMILLAYRHGLRASELCDLRWDQCDFTTASIHIRRVKKGTPATHPLTGLSYVRCANCNGKARKILSSSFPSAGRRLRQLALQGCWSVRRKKPSSKSKSIPTCSGMLAASSWQTMARIRVPSRHTLDTRIFSTLCAIRNSHQRGSKIFGRISIPWQFGRVSGNTERARL